MIVEKVKTYGYGPIARY